MRGSQLDGDDCYKTKARGMAVLTTPLLNKGTAFTAEEREELGLDRAAPAGDQHLEAQVKAAYAQYQRLPDALNKNIYLTALHDRNEVLFYRLLSGHLREMIPIVNDLTVGMAMQQYHHECRRPRGVYLSIDHLDGIEAAFENLGAGPEDIDLILATDAEQILGLGDWGVGGIEISIGKLAIYTAAGGIDPTRVIPVMLDVGTNRESLLKDPMYVGNRHARVRGERYDAFIEAYVETVTKLYPSALLQWEDFAPGNGRRILEQYRDRICYIQRRHAGHGRHHAGGGGFRGSRLRIADAQPTRGDLWRWNGGYRNRRSDPRCDDARGPLPGAGVRALLAGGRRRPADRRHGRSCARLSGALCASGRGGQALEARRLQTAPSTLAKWCIRHGQPC